MVIIQIINISKQYSLWAGSLIPITHKMHPKTQIIIWTIMNKELLCNLLVQLGAAILTLRMINIWFVKKQEIKMEISQLLSKEYLYVSTEGDSKLDV